MEADRFDRLTEFEAQALRLWARHGNVSGVAWDCGISVDAAYKRVARAREKLGARSNYEAAQSLVAHEREDGVQSMDVQSSPLPLKPLSDMIDGRSTAAGDSPEAPLLVLREQIKHPDFVVGMPSIRPEGRAHNDLNWWQLLLKVIAIAAAGALGAFIILAMIFAVIDLLGQIHDQTSRGNRKAAQTDQILESQHESHRIAGRADRTAR